MGHLDPATSRSFDAYGLATRIAVALLSYAVADALWAAARKPDAPLRFEATFPGHSLLALLSEGWPCLLFIAVMLLVRGLAPPFGWRNALGNAVVSSAFCAYLYTVLVEYTPFKSSPVLAVGLVGLAGLLSAAWSLPTTRGNWIRAAGSGVTLLAAAGVMIANYTFHTGLYATLHATASLASVALVLTASLLAPAPRSGRVIALPIFLASIAALVAFAIFGPPGTSNYFLLKSELGLMVAQSDEAGESDHSSVTKDENAVARFMTAAQLPELPRPLEEYNLLVIASEATRFDKTSLNPDFKYDTTPNLKRASKSAFVAPRAYSPSSGTLHSMASLFTMKLPSAIQLETWKQPWFGALSEEETTAAELLQSAGYETFWIGHNYNKVFPKGIVGFEQGFQHVDRVRETTRNVNQKTDTKIAKKAVEHLRKLSKSDEKFFGLIFFASPHGPYINHRFKDLPKRTNAEKYLQEIRAMDIAFGQVFDELSRLKMFEDTIVVFLSDHGEEFGEHGGHRHKSTVYTESIHVPYLVWVPGMEGTTIRKPISTAFTFPWLFLHAGNEKVRSAAHDVLRDYHGPILRDTEGAVFSELVGHDRMKTTLITQSLKLDYDHRSRLFEFYNIDKDPLEQDNIIHAPEQAKDVELLTERFRAYERIRDKFSRHTMRPDKVAPR